MLQRIWWALLPLVILTTGFSTAYAGTMNGVVVNSSGREGTVFVSLHRSGEGPTGLGVGVVPAGSAPIPFTIHGVPDGTYAVSAYLDASSSGSRHANDPFTAIDPVTVNGGVGDTGLLVLSSSGTVLPPGALLAPLVFPATGGVVLRLDNLPVSNGAIIPDRVNISCGTLGAINNVPAINGVTAYFPSPSGTAWSCKATPVINGTSLNGYTSPASTVAMAGDSCTSRGSCATGTSVTGKVIFPGLTPGASSTLLLSLASVSDPASPPYFLLAPAGSGLSYAVPGVAPGTYRIRASLDYNGGVGDGVIGSGDLSQDEYRLPLIQVTGPGVVVPDISLETRNSFIRLGVDHMLRGGDDYALKVSVQDGTKIPVSVTVSNGSGSCLQHPVSLTRLEQGGISHVTTPFPARPLVGDSCTAIVSYGDGTEESVALPITPLLDDFPQPTLAAADVKIANLSIPHLSWQQGTPLPPFPFAYRSEVSGGGISAATDLLLASTLDAMLPLTVPLVANSAAGMRVSLTDPFGNSASTQQNFTVRSTGPTVTGFTPATAVAGSTVQIHGTGLSTASAVSFNGTPATFSVTSDTTLATTVPPHASSGPLYVTAGGTAAASNASFTPTIGASGKVWNYAGAALSGVTVGVTDKPSVTTTSNEWGMYFLPASGGIPAGVPFVLKVTGPTGGYHDVYSPFLSSKDDLIATDYTLFTDADLLTCGFGATKEGSKGVIRSRLVDVNRSGIAGATVSVTSWLHPQRQNPYPVIYDIGGTPAVGTTATDAVGGFSITDIDEGDIVTVRGDKAGWGFTATSFQSHGGAVSEGLILGDTLPIIEPAPGPGKYAPPLAITFSSSSPATIYYTTNGNDPVFYGIPVTGPVTLTADTSLRYVGKNRAGVYGPSATGDYALSASDATPPVVTANPPGTVQASGSYASVSFPLDITFTANEPATVFYTTNGADPTVFSPSLKVYSAGGSAGPLTLSQPGTLKFFGRDTSGNISQLQSWTYTKVVIVDTTPPVVTVTPPGSSQSSGVYVGTFPLAVTFGASEPATIYYTTSGADPTISSSSLRVTAAGGSTTSIPLTLPGTSLKFFGRDDTGNQSTVSTWTYNQGTTTTISLNNNPAEYGASVSFTATVAPATATGTVQFTLDGADTGVAVPLSGGSATSQVYTTLAVGTHQIGARYNGGGGYVTSSAPPVTETITKAAQTITFAPISGKTYGDTSFALTATASSGLGVTFTSSNPAVATVNGNVVTIIGAGSVTFTASQPGNGNYSAAPTVSRSVVVAKRLLTVTAVDASRLYGSPNPLFTALYSGFVNGDTAAAVSGSFLLTSSATSQSPSGTYVIAVAQGTATAANYTFTFVNGLLTVAKAPLTITASNLARSYGGSNPPLTVVYTGFVNGETEASLSGAPVLSTTASSGSPVGSYPISVSPGSLSSGNYDFIFNAGSLVVGKAPLSIAVSDASRVYGSPNPQFTVVYTGFVNGETAAILTGTPVITTQATQASPAGTYAVVAAQGTVSTANYSLAFVDGVLTVTKATLLATTADVSRMYGSGNPVFTPVFSGFVNGDTSAVITGSPGFTTTATALSPAGSYVITASLGTATAANYTFTLINAALTVTKAPLTVTAADASRVYGGANPAFTVVYSGFLNGDTPSALSGAPTLATTATAGSSAGSYPISVALGSLAASNYTFILVDGTLTVFKADQSITFATLAARTYGDPAFTLNATATSNLSVMFTSSNSAVATVVGNLVTIVGAGTTVITAAQPGDGNYNPAPAVPRTLAVAKATATVTLGSLSATYDGTPKEATATTVPAGLTVLFTYDNSSTPPTKKGKYTVVATISDPNYQGSASGTFTIERGTQKITFAPLPSKTYGDPTFTLNATTSSGLPVSYTSSNTQVATVTGNVVTIVGAGSTTITASQAGDTNFNAAQSVSQTLTVSKATITVSTTPFSRAYGSPNPAFTPAYTGFVNGETQNVITGSPTIASSATVTTPAGIDMIAVGVGTLAAANYTFATVNGTLTITKVPLTVTAASFSRGYGTSNPVFTATYSGFVMGETAGVLNGTPTLTTTATESSPSGTYAISASAGSLTAANYSFVFVDGVLTVAKGSQTITFAALAPRSFGSPAFTLDGSTTSGLPLGYASSNPAVATVSGSTVTIVGVGSTTITASQGGNDNYTSASVTQTLTVEKGVATITLGSMTGTFDASPHAVTTTTSPAGLPVTITYNSIATAPTNAGDYAVTVVITDANYQGTATGTLTIAKANQTITFAALPAKTYGDAPFVLSAVNSSGLPVTYASSAPAVATVNGTTVTLTGGGAVTISASQAGDANHNPAATVSQQLTVNSLLNLEFAGTGTGTVTIPGNGSCSVGCSRSVATAVPLILTALAAPGSSFGGWSGCDSVSGTACTVSASGARAVTATFMVVPLGGIRLSDNGTVSYFTTVGAAYNAIASGTNTSILIPAGRQTETVVFDKNYRVTISGGYDSTLATVTGVTSIQSLTISNGTVTIGGGISITGS